jgi:hypothetical protein
MRTEPVRGHLVTIDGTEVFIRRQALSRALAHECGLPRVVFVVQGADPHPTLRQAIRQVRSLVRAERATARPNRISGVGSAIECR